MKLLTGTIDCGEECPTIYTILSKDLLYIGETQKNPAIRWSSHLAARGSFRQAVIRQGEFDVDYFEKIFFISFSCFQFVQQHSKLQWKTITQAIEYGVHCTLYANPSILPIKFRIISSIQKTTPRHFNMWDNVMAFSKNIAKELAEQIAKNA